jgi:hypothetical protein
MTEKIENSKEIHAYTPGLKVKNKTVIKKVRRLPILGDVLVNEGDSVDYNTIVARTFLSGDPYIIRAAPELGIEPHEIPQYTFKGEGEKVQEGEVISQYKAFFGIINKQIKSPVDGTIESISASTGQIIVRGSPIPLELTAYILGEVIEILPKEGVVVETYGSLIQGIFGLGGERHGKICVLVSSPNEKCNASMINEENKGDILIVGSEVSSDIIKRGKEIGVEGIIAGGINHDDLIELMGGEVGVAITGEEDIDLTLIITEGFGDLSISQRAFEILKKHDGHMASINGTTQIRAGVIRPEIIIPHREEDTSKSEEADLNLGIVPGTPVRIIRNPYFGEIGEVTSLPIELQKIETESKVRVLGVKLGDGKEVIIPRANVEIIEE